MRLFSRVLRWFGDLWHEEYAFEFGDIVRLKSARPDFDLVAGSPGFIWGIYGPDYFEASFLDSNNEITEEMFETEEVELSSLDSVSPEQRAEFEDIARVLRRSADGEREDGQVGT